MVTARKAIDRNRHVREKQVEKCRAKWYNRA